MKKLYTAPELYFEEYEINTSIAGGCGHPLYADSINSGDVDHCTYDIYAGTTVFSGMNGSCEIHPADGEYNICYQVATPNELIFNS